MSHKDTEVTKLCLCVLSGLVGNFFDAQNKKHTIQHNIRC